MCLAFLPHFNTAAGWKDRDAPLQLDTQMVPSGALGIIKRLLSQAMPIYAFWGVAIVPVTAVNGSDVQGTARDAHRAAGR